MAAAEVLSVALVAVAQEGFGREPPWLLLLVSHTPSLLAQAVLAVLTVITPYSAPSLQRAAGKAAVTKAAVGAMAVLAAVAQAALVLLAGAG